MAQKLKGVGGVLGGLISPDSAEPAPEEEIVRTAKPAESSPIESSPRTADKPVRSGAARRGRPPGPKATVALPKEKVTLRLGKDLMDDYRDWSWEARCPLGELVERALLQYRKHRARSKSD